MIKQAFFLWIMLWFSSPLIGQEVVVADTPAPIPPFEGTIYYLLEANAPNAPDVSAFLPDTMVLTVAYPWVQIEYRGGIADSTMNRIRWNAEEGETQVIYPPGKLYFATPESYLPPPVKSVRATGTGQKLAGMPCRKYQVNYEGDPGVDYLQVCDSLIFPKSEADTALLFRPIFLHPDFPGIPLKMTRIEGKSKTVITAIKIDREKPDPNSFTVPEKWGYRIFNPRSGDRFPILKDREK